MVHLDPVQRFITASGIRIYRMPMVLFPNDFVGYAYLVLGCGVPTLIDAGSGFDQSDQDLVAGLAAVANDFGEDFRISDIERIIVTHGHVDHFGGVAAMIEASGGAKVGIHSLDRRVLTAYEERVIMATKDLRIYFERAGIKPSLRSSLIDMYGFAKKHVRSVPVSFDLEDEQVIDQMQFFHTPGHCPGQVCIKIDDILISADHILSYTTPHQAPESITHYMGLGHYATALTKISKVEGIRLGLGGHEDPIENIYKRIEEIRQSHRRKLARVYNIVRDAQRALTISEISLAMYPDKHNYDILLALEEAGAHIEYLYQHGYLSVANLEEVELLDNPALLYKLGDTVYSSEGNNS